MTDPDPPTPLDDSFLDRIVDGGLSPAELRAAIDRLEREHDGWKRCALAFLEAQCWRESFQAADERSPLRKERIQPHGRPQPLHTSQPGSDSRRFALAAGIAALAFALGWHAHPDRFAKTRGPEAAPTLETVHHPVGPAAPSTIDLPPPAAEPIGPSREEPRSSDPIPPIITVGRLRVGPAEGAPAVPLLAGAGIDEQWVRDQPPPFTEHQQAMLEQQGYQIDRRRRLITARLDDGRRVTVPVDHVQVRYTGIEPL